MKTYPKQWIVHKN